MALLVKQYEDEGSEIEGDTCIIIYDVPDELLGDYTTDHIIARLTNDEAKDLIYHLAARCELNWTGEFAKSVIDELADYAAQGPAHALRHSARYQQRAPSMPRTRNP